LFRTTGYGKNGLNRKGREILEKRAAAAALAITLDSC
jgi:hypothetical protein